jgi:hypothetical protein
MIRQDLRSLLFTGPRPTNNGLLRKLRVPGEEPFA